MVGLSDGLGSKIAAIEFCNQRLCQIRWAKITVEESLFHRLDYNRVPVHALIMQYVQKSFWFQYAQRFAASFLVLGLLHAWLANSPARAQSIETATPSTGASDAYITQTYTEAVNVRTGPSTVNYPVIGQLPVGATAPALGASPSREWIEIGYPAGPGGVGWVYAANVTLTGSVQVVEPPPTATPLATATIDPTLAAAFQVAPTETRLPTFTPPPPLSVPTFSSGARPSTGIPAGFTIIAVMLVGGFVLAVSFLGRR